MLGVSKRSTMISDDFQALSVRFVAPMAATNGLEIIQKSSEIIVRPYGDGPAWSWLENMIEDISEDDVWRLLLLSDRFNDF